MISCICAPKSQKGRVGPQKEVFFLCAWRELLVLCTHNSAQEHERRTQEERAWMKSQTQEHHTVHIILLHSTHTTRDLTWHRLSLTIIHSIKSTSRNNRSAWIFEHKWWVTFFFFLLFSFMYILFFFISFHVLSFLSFYSSSFFFFYLFSRCSYHSHTTQT